MNPLPAPSTSNERPAKRVRTARLWLWVLAFAYGIGALVFFFFPNELIYLVNVGPKVFKITEAIPEPADRFWVVIASAAMAMFSGLSLFAAESPGIRGYNWVHLLGKTVTAAGYLYMYLNEHHYFVYLLGLFADLLIGGIVLWTLFTLRAPISPLPGTGGAK